MCTRGAGGARRVIGVLGMYVVISPSTQCGVCVGGAGFSGFTRVCLVWSIQCSVSGANAMVLVAPPRLIHPVHPFSMFSMYTPPSAVSICQWASTAAPSRSNQLVAVTLASHSYTLLLCLAGILFVFLFPLGGFPFKSVVCFRFPQAGRRAHVRAARAHAHNHPSSKGGKPRRSV